MGMRRNLRMLVNTVKLGWYFLRYGVELLVRRPPTMYGRAAWLMRFCAAALAGVGVKVTVEGEFPARGAVVSNHLSYVDILLFASLRPCVFCSKAEVEGWPVVGWMTREVGTVLVERGRGGSALRARAGMEAAAAEGLPVVFFPEGTTTNGREMLPFHSGLLAQALAVGEPIWAAFVTYSLEADNGPEIRTSRAVCWGEYPFLVHVRRFLSLRGVHATVRFAPVPIAFKHGPDNRKLAAVEAREALLALSGGARGAADAE
jgi:1-acyl-sn-glycerol-3-phosphate acyltransferase